MTHISRSAARTESIAAGLAKKLKRGACVALYGELSAGKTQFVRGLVRGLGLEARAVHSPTFVLLNIYRGKKWTVYHLDAYRVGGSDDFEAIGFSELLEQGGVVVVEWADRVAELLPKKRIDVKIETTGKRTRKITIERWT